MIVKHLTHRTQILNWVISFSALTGILLTLVGFRFFEFMPEFANAKATSFIVAGVFSHFAFMSLVACLLLAIPAVLLSHWFPSTVRAMQLGFVLIASAMALLLIADTFVYAQYRFHISGFVFAMLWQAGNDIIHLSWLTWLLIAAVLTVTVWLFVMIANWSSALIQRSDFRRIKWAYLSALIASFLYSNVVHLFADATYDSNVTTLVRHVPMFSPLTGKKALLNSGLLDAEAIREQRQQLKSIEKTDLNYPRSAIVSQAPQTPYNVLLVVVDSLRYDVAASDAMPNLQQFKQGSHSQVFEQHFSGGNSTRTGIFNLFYGLPGTYWTAFSTNQKAPVLMETFAKYDYEFQILASAPLTQPAFDRTAFANINDLQLRTEGETPWQRDSKIAEQWQAYVAKRTSQLNPKPFFGMLFFDGVHGYSLPENAERPFSPAWQRVDHFKLGPDTDPTEYLNLYRNAAYQVDQHIGDVLNQLHSTGLMDNTIVIVTSDHGEEFNDNQLNYWGHGSNFSDIQMKVPLAIHWPNGAASAFQHRTSHADISVTLMQQLFMVDNPVSDYAVGYSLYDTQRVDWTIAGSYVNYAIVQPDQRTVTYQDGSYEILTESGQPLSSDRLNPKVAMDVMAAMAQFYK